MSGSWIKLLSQTTVIHSLFWQPCLESLWPSYTSYLSSKKPVIIHNRHSCWEAPLTKVSRLRTGHLGYGVQTFLTSVHAWCHCLLIDQIWPWPKPTKETETAPHIPGKNVPNSSGAEAAGENKHLLVQHNYSWGVGVCSNEQLRNLCTNKICKTFSSWIRKHPMSEFSDNYISKCVRLCKDTVCASSLENARQH